MLGQGQNEQKIAEILEKQKSFMTNDEINILAQSTRIRTNPKWEIYDQSV